MAEEESDKEVPIKAVADALSSARRVLVVTHRHPDGDAIGSALGLYHMLCDLGKSAVFYCPDIVPPALRFLPGVPDVHSRLDDEPFDAAVLLDTPESGLLPDGFPDAALRGTFIVIDHHLKAEPMGDLVIRKQASAVGEILHQIAIESGWPINNDAAVCLYTAIVSDTSSFKYQSATPDSHRVAADLLTRGVSPQTVSSYLFDSVSLVRQRVLASVLKTLQIHLNGRLALIHCTQDMLKAAGASMEDTSGLINYARSIGGVVAALFLREQANGNIRVSIRSKGAFNAGLFAEKLGGGGHINAGGCVLRNMTLEAAKKTIQQIGTSLFD